MKLPRTLRPLVLFFALLLALAPLTAAADQEAEAANRAARCKLLLAGTKIPGKLRLDECTAYATTPATTASGDVRALASLPGSGPKCPHAGTGLTKVERNAVNAYAIAKRKALKDNKPEPAPSAEVAALMACS